MDEAIVHGRLHVICVAFRVENVPFEMSIRVNLFGLIFIKRSQFVSFGTGMVSNCRQQIVLQAYITNIINLSQLSWYSRNNWCRRFG